MSDQIDRSTSSQNDRDFASQLLDQGESLQTVETELLQRGVPQDKAVGIINGCMTKWTFLAAAMLSQGHPREVVKQTLVEEGLNPVLASLVVDRVRVDNEADSSGGLAARLLIRAVGILFFVAGLGLVLGNRTGAFVTFPFAGTIVIVIGALISSTAEKR